MMHQRPSDYLVTYKAFDKSGRMINEGKLKAKNKFSDIAAGMGAQMWLKKTYPQISTVSIIKCEAQDLFVSLTNDLEDMIGKFKR